MMKITCPWCGARPENEFTCGGQSQIVRPDSPEGVTDEAWGDYMFFRANVRGEHDERWRHTFGCGQWFNLRRDTLTHAMSPADMAATVPAGAAREGGAL